MTSFFMEDNLDMPLRQVLQVMQARIMQQTTYFGVPALMSPTDSWVYQELVVELRPDWIVELGTHQGGGALMFAHLCDALGGGKVVSVDISQTQVAASVREHPRVTLIESDACAAFDRVAGLVGGGSALVIEDSSHTYANTLSVLRAYTPLVQVGGYFVVEDGICRHGLEVGPSPGPYEAVQAFLEESGHFAADRHRESFLVTWNPKGYLVRVSV